MSPKPRRSVDVIARMREVSTFDPETGCQLVTGPGRPTRTSRYPRIWNGEQQVSGHRAAWEAAHGPIPDGMCILHRCDRPACVNVEHLSLGTQQDNLRDCREKGRARQGHLRGERHWHAKLSESQVRDIRRRVECGETFTAIAASIRVARSTVGRAAKGLCWSHV